MKLPLEEQFIINCLHSKFDSRRKDKFADIKSSNIDWDVVFKKAVQWQVAPLLYKIIESQTFAFTSIPERILQKLRIFYLKLSCINVINFESLNKILEVFNVAGIKVILLKGSYLANFVYQEVGLRFMNDIDILVRKEDLSKAGELLHRMGYVSSPKDHNAQHDFMTNKYKTHQHLPPFSHQKGINILEVHWTIVRPFALFNINIEGLWKRAKTMGINGTKVLVPSLEDTLLCLSLHTSFHDKFMARGLMPYCDIATTINRYDNEIDWDQLQFLADEWGVEKYLYLTLRLSQEILGAKVPKEILHALKPEPFDENIFSEAQTRILSPNTKGPIYLEKIYADISLKGKISYLFEEIFIAVDSKHIYIYNFVRFFSLLRRYITFCISLLVFRIKHKKSNLYNYNLDMWLSFSEKTK